MEKSAPLKYIKESGISKNGKHYLGKLAGEGANFLSPTRNGRRYPYELWVNVENSDDFKEGMETLTIFGEADHPETRVDTSIKEIAIVLTKFEIRKNEGIVYVEFDILDTPNGRILKELLDYGSKIGVSSRGLGDEVVKDGETIIDPETYIFYGFDAVVMPAVIGARPAVVESAHRNLIDSFNKEIESTSSEVELQSIKRIVESVGLPELDSVKESLDKKLTSISDGDNISTKLETDLGVLAKENEELKATITRLESKLSANNIRITRMKTQLRESVVNSRSMSKSLQENLKLVANYESSLVESAEQMDELTDLMKSTEMKYKNKVRAISESNRSLRTKVSGLTSELNSVKNKQNESTKSLKKYEDMLNESKKSCDNLRNQVSELSSKLSKIKSSKALSEQKTQSNVDNLKKRLAEVNNRAKKTIQEYLRVKCAASGINMSTVQNLLPENYTVDDINKIVSELSDRKTRLDKVPIAIPPRSIVINESSSISPEDRQTMSILTGSIY